MFAFSSPTSYRAWNDAATLAPGEVYFDHAPGSAELAAAFPAYVAPPTNLPSISRRQFFQQLAVQGIVTDAEALAAMAGTIPSELVTLIATLPTAQQFPARMLVAGATDFDRTNSFTAAIGAAYSLTSPQIDALWIAAAAL